MSKLVTNFGDSTTTGNTILQQNLTVQGAFSTFSGNILAGSPFSSLGNVTNKFNSLFAASANITFLNTTSLTSTTGFVGINCPGGDSTLKVAGNVYASNALSAPTVIATVSMNAATSNISSIFGPLGVVGVNQVPVSLGASLQVGGNLYASNALSAPTVIASVSMNAATSNTSSIFGLLGVVGVNQVPVALGASLQVGGNLYASNALSAPTVIATVSMNAATSNISSIFGPLGVVGVNQVPVALGASLQVGGNLYASNALSAPTVIASVSMNAATSNTSSIFGPLGVVGVNQVPVALGASLQVGGNLYASNALSAPTVIATVSMNAVTSNTASIFGPLGVVGVNQVPAALGASLQVGGNVYVTAAVSTPNITATTMNITSVLNTQAIFSSTGLLGINTSNPTSNLHIQGNLYASNSLSAPNVFATTSLNVSTLNTTSIYSKTGFLGINTAVPTATLHIEGNLYATSINALSINAFTYNVTIMNTTAIFGTYGILGVDGPPIGSALDITGNLYASNALTSPSIISTTANITTLNTTSLYFSTGATVGINTTATGASLMIGGNLYASNALTATNIIATGTLYYGEDLFKRGPYLTANLANASTIQAWISATCNASSRPTKSWWATSPTPVYGNIASGPTGSTDYGSSVLLPDGRVLFVPRFSSTVGFFNPASGLFSTVSPAGLSAVHGEFRSCVLAPNGNVIFIPYGSSNVGVFNPVSYSYSNIVVGAQPGNQTFQGGVIGPTGNIIMIPRNSANIGVFNPTSLTLTNVGPIAGQSLQLFGCGTLLPNGNVVMSPLNSQNIGMYNSMSLLPSGFTNVGPVASSGSWEAATLAPNGNVVFAPSTSLNVMVYNPSFVSSPIGAGGFSNLTIGAQGGTYSFAGSTLLPSGNIVFSPFGASNVGMFDPLSTPFRYSNCARVSTQTTKFMGCTLIPDGRVVFSPYNSTNVGVLNTMVPVDPAFCLSPYFNKF
jgi:hypothetical protein